LNSKPISYATKQKGTENYYQKNDPLAPINVCSGCGVKIIGQPQLRKIGSLQRLQLTAEQLMKYNTISDQYKRSFAITDQYKRSFAITKVKNSFFHIRLYSQNENQIVDLNSEIPVCGDCDVSGLRIPRYSFGNGYDYGDPSAIGLTPLSSAEAILIDIIIS